MTCSPSSALNASKVSWMAFFFSAKLLPAPPGQRVFEADRGLAAKSACFACLAARKGYPEHSCPC
eukprot:1374084-Prorocentrum_lima.AAC.1